jgi:hypothetical protein
MANLFDRLQDKTFDTCLKWFGYEATWGASTEKVLFNAPNTREELSGVDYAPLGYYMEYRAGQFAGLFELAREGTVQAVTVNGVSYVVRSVEAVHDGKTYRAHMSLSTDVVVDVPLPGAGDDEEEYYEE